MTDEDYERYEGYVNQAKDYIESYDPNETVDYNDSRLTDVKNEQSQKEKEINDTYDSLTQEANKFYQDQIEASKEYAQKQSELQQQNTDLAIEEINQQKDKAEKDYTKEQKGSYVDYQKQTNKYGVNAERMAVSGLSNSGYSESSNVSMYNTYQNRVATARESYSQAVVNYNNSIKEARLANSSALAEIAYNALQQQLELALQGFQYKNSLLEARTNQLNINNSRYDELYQRVLDQMNQEIANRQNRYYKSVETVENYNNILEQMRQFNAELEEKRAQREENRRQFEKEYAQREQQYQREYDLSMQKIAEERAASQAAQQQLLVQDTQQDNSLNANTQNASKFMESMGSAIDNAMKIIKNPVKQENAEQLKKKLPILQQAIIEQYEKGVITKEQAYSLFNKMEGYI